MAFVNTLPQVCDSLVRQLLEPRQYNLDMGYKH